MIPQAEEAQAVAAREAISSGETNLAFVLWVGDTEFGEDVMQAQWGNDTGGPAISADLTLGLVLPKRLEDEEVKFAVSVDGIYIPLIYGSTSYAESSSGSGATGAGGERRAITDPLLFATNGIHWPETTLDEYVEYSGWTPEDVLRDAVSRIPYTHTFIYPVGIPLLYYTKDRNDSGFKPEQTVADIASEVEKQAALITRDTGDGGFTAAPDVELGRDTATERVFDSSDIVDWRRPPRKQLRYSDVVVFRVNSDGTDDYRESAPVYYRNRATPHRAFYVASTDDGADAPEKASQLAYDLSRRFSRGVHGDEITLPFFDPTIAKQDPFRVNDLDRDLEGTWQRAYLCWVDTFKHDYKTGKTPTLSTVVDYTALLLEEEKLAVPTIIVPGVSGGVLVTVGPPFGHDVGGFWYDPDVAKDAHNNPYASLDALGAWVDPAISSFQDGHDDGLTQTLGGLTPSTSLTPTTALTPLDGFPIFTGFWFEMPGIIVDTGVIVDANNIIQS